MCTHEMALQQNKCETETFLQCCGKTFVEELLKQNVKILPKLSENPAVLVVTLGILKSSGRCLKNKKLKLNTRVHNLR